MQLNRRPSFKDASSFNKGVSSDEQGFTLLSICMSLIIIGIILAAGVQAYSVYALNERLTLNQQRIKDAMTAIQSFKQTTGAYPCPAPLDVARNAATYGSPQCATIAAVGTCLNGICFEESLPARFAPGTPSALVRVGAIPFRLLQLDEEASLDAYDSRLVYAVTDSLTNSVTYDEEKGAINIVDATGQSVTDIPSSTNFLVLSPGPNRNGAFTHSGISTSTCAGAAGSDEENCRDFTAVLPIESKYLVAPLSPIYDDTIDYFEGLKNQQWKRTSANDNDIEAMVLDNIGAGVSAPANTLDIAQGVSGAENGALRVGDKPRANQYCSKDGTNCWDPIIFTGDNTVAGQGMKCPPGQYMIGIEAGAPKCGTPKVVCNVAPNTVMMGIDPTTGAAICGTAALSCAPGLVQICPSVRDGDQSPFTQPVSIPFGANGDIKSVSDPASYLGSAAHAFRCENGVWKRNGSLSGICTCVVPPPGGEVVVNNVSCTGLGTGTATQPSTFNPATCSWTNGAVNYSTCTCPIPATAKAPTPAGTCPGSYTTGSMVWNWVFDPDPAFCNWRQDSITDTCACAFAAAGATMGAGSTRTIIHPTVTCPPYKPGTVTLDQTFADKPTCNWVNGATNSNCICDTATEFTELRNDCEPVCTNKITDAVYRFNYVDSGTSCDPGPKTLKTAGTCQNKSFKWRIVSGILSAGETTPGTNPEADALPGCNCATMSAGTTSLCYKTNNGKYDIFRCKCAL